MANALYQGQCFSTPALAAAYMCGDKYPQYQQSSATVSWVTSCQSISPAGVVTLKRDVTGSGTTNTTTYTPQFPPCVEGGAKFDAASVAFLAVCMALGYIGGRLR